MIQLPIWVDQLCSYVQFLGSYLNGEIFTKSAGDSSCALTRMFLTQPLFAKEKKGIATDIWTTVKNITFLSKIFNATLLTPLNIPDQLKKLCYFFILFAWLLFQTDMFRQYRQNPFKIEKVDIYTTSQYILAQDMVRRHCFLKFMHLLIKTNPVGGGSLKRALSFCDCDVIKRTFTFTSSLGD